MIGSRRRRALLAAVATAGALTVGAEPAAAQLIAPCQPGRCGDRVTLGVSKRVVRVGQNLYFQGAVLNEEAPVVGALLTLQVRRGGRWQTFKALTTNHNGVFVGRYRFRLGCPVGSISVIEFGDSGPLMRTLANREHLDKHLRELPGT